MSITTVTTISTPSRFDRVSNYSALGGLIGAGVGAGLSLTALPFVGALTAPIAAAIGGAAGLVIGTVIGLFRTRSEAVHQSTAGAGQLGTPPPAPSNTGGQLPPPLPA
ncbi:MAG: hypothetical protein H7287_13770 [Thermoleophilia bacterium]|nr:hypothetical protein [Thermoleophilia bacterium]